MLKITASIVVAILLLQVEALAHSGRLNAQGCHGGSQPYHCHRASSEMVPSSNGGYRLKCSAGSQSKDCVNQTTTSAEGRDQSEALSTYNIQTLLKRHCPYLPASFVDGVSGAQTRAALATFQQAYGLSVDGEFGPNTQAALLGPVNGKCVAK